MRRCCQSSFKRGLSLPEVLVSMCLVAFVLGGMAKIIREGVRFHNTHSAALEVQQNCLLAMRWLNDDLGEGSLSSLLILGNGFVFGSPRDLDHQLSLDGDLIQWQKFLCYYTEQNNGIYRLVREQLAFERPSNAPPPIPASLNVGVFKTEAPPGRVLARHVESLTCTLENPSKVTLKANYRDGAFTLKVETFITLTN